MPIPQIADVTDEQLDASNGNFMLGDRQFGLSRKGTRRILVEIVGKRASWIAHIDPARDFGYVANHPNGMPSEALRGDDLRDLIHRSISIFAPS